MHDGLSPSQLRLLAGSFALGLTLLAMPRTAVADEGQPLPALPAPPAPPPVSAQPTAPQAVVSAQPTDPQAVSAQAAAAPQAQEMPASSSMQPTFLGSEAPPKDVPARKTHPRYWLTATGAVTFGGAYVANAVLFPLATLAPPDGQNSPSTLFYVTPVVGPFALAAKLSQYDTGLRRFEWIDGSLQTVGLAMVAASLLFPVEEEKSEKRETATIHPVVAPRFVGASGTF